MIRDLVDLLDRRWKLLDEETGFDFARHCFPFLDQLRGDSRTAALLTDLRRDEQRSSRARTQADDDARTSLIQILDVLEKFAPDSFPPPRGGQDDIVLSLPMLRRLLTKPAVELDDEEWHAGSDSGSDSRLNTAIRGLQEVAQNARREDLKERVDDVERALEHAKRTRRMFVGTSAAAAFARIERELGALHPSASMQDQHAERRARLLRTREGRSARIRDALFGEGVRLVERNKTGEAAGADDVLGMRKNMKRIYEEIRHRLAAERSLVAVFERYRQRCQWYEAEKLQAIAQSGRGKAEDRLTETLTMYLFDHGLNPLTRPLAGRLEPDLLGPDAPFSFYVEAKQYTKPCSKYLLDGMQQVWDMLDQLRGSRFDVMEAFYVVYRRSGPRYTFRESPVQHGDRVVHLLMIDLAPSDERGSNAEQSYVFETADLMPRPATAPESQRRQVGQRPSRRRPGGPR